jgi:hypothetical protein
MCRRHPHVRPLLAALAVKAITLDVRGRPVGR